MSEDQSLKTGIKRKSDHLKDKEAELLVDPGLCDDEITFVFDDSRELYVSRGLICCASPVFRAMFSVDLKEKHSGVVEMKGKEYEDVLDFLKTLHPNIQKPIEQDDVYEMLRLAEEYQVKRSIEICKDVLQQKLTVKLSKVNKGPELESTEAIDECLENLLTAVKYKFETLRDDAIKQISNIGSIVYLKDVCLTKYFGSFKSAFGTKISYSYNKNADILTKRRQCRNTFKLLPDSIKLQIVCARLNKIDDGSPSVCTGFFSDFKPTPLFGS